MENKSYSQIVLDAIAIFANNNITKAEAARQAAEGTDFNAENIRKCIVRSEAKRLREEGHSGLVAHCENRGIDVNDVRLYWDKTKEYSVKVNLDSNEKTYKDLRDEIIESMDAHSPKYPNIERDFLVDGHLLVVDPADIHIGKLATAFETGEDYNSHIAVLRVHEGVEGILQKVKGFNIDQIMLVIGNDILHVDSPRNTTTSGTNQDVSQMWYTNFLMAKQLYVEVIEKLTGVADVHVVFNPSNHDYTNGFFLADAIKSWFRHSTNITFDCSIAHRKYYRYFENLIGTTHGDGAKQSDLGLLMAEEAKKDWGVTKHRYFYTHHVHHKTSRDMIGITLESLRSPSGSDSWHHRNGYGVGGVKAIEGFLHSKEHGQICRITHIF
jgi:hypothetical protein